MSSQPTSAGTRVFERFMASGAGRATRALFGVTVVAAGLAVVPRPAGLVVAAFGLVPIAAGLFNLCPIAPFWGGHFFGLRYCQPRNGTNSD
jgi:Zn-dependent protease